MQPQFPPTPTSQRKRRAHRAKDLKGARIAVTEIYESEKSYVRSLRVLVEEFATPLQNSTIITPDQHAGIFSNIHQILLLNDQLLQDMKPLGHLRVDLNNDSHQEETGGLETVYDIFNSFAPFLKIYIGYVTNYNTRALTLLPQLNNENSKFRKFCEQKRKEPKVRNLGLNSFLIMPIQRVMRYRILLEVLIKRLTRENSSISTTHSSNIKKLRNALKQVTQVSFHIDKSIDRRENMNKVLEISEMVEGTDPRLKNLVSPTRAFIKQGKLLRGTRRGKLKLFQVWLFNDMLLYGSKDLAHTKYRVHKIISLHGTTVHKVRENNVRTSDKNRRHGHRMSETGAIDMVKHGEHPEDDPKELILRCSIAVRSPEKSFVLVADTEQECNEWLVALQGAIAALVANVIDLGDGRKSIRIRNDKQQTQGIGGIGGGAGRTAPVWTPDNAVKNCVRCHRNFSHLFRRKHHCRSCGKVVCNACSLHRKVLPYIHATKSLRICDKCAVGFDQEKHSTKKGGRGYESRDELIPTTTTSFHPEQLNTKSFGLSGVKTSVKMSLNVTTDNANDQMRRKEDQTHQPHVSNSHRRTHSKKKETGFNTLDKVEVNSSQPSRSKLILGSSLKTNGSIHQKNSRLLTKRLSSARMMGRGGRSDHAASSFQQQQHHQQHQQQQQQQHQQQQHHHQQQHLRRINSSAINHRSPSLRNPIGMKRASRSTPAITSSQFAPPTTTTLDVIDAGASYSSSSSEEEEEDSTVHALNDADDDWLLGTPKFGLRTTQLTEFSTNMLGHAGNAAPATLPHFFGDDVDVDLLVEEQEQEEEKEEKKTKDIPRKITIQTKIKAPPLPLSRRKQGQLRVHPEKLRQQRVRAERERQAQRETAMVQRGSMYSSMSSMPSSDNGVLITLPTHKRQHSDGPPTVDKPRRQAPEPPSLRSRMLKKKPHRRAKTPAEIPNSMLKTSRSGKNLLAFALAH